MISKASHINFYQKAILLLALIFWFGGLKSQLFMPPPALVVEQNMGHVNLRTQLLVFDTVSNLSPKHALEALQNPNISHFTRSTSFGFSTNYFWLYFSVQNKTNQPTDLILLVNNPHINKIELYEIEGSSPQLIAQGGDGIPFFERTYIDRRFAASIHLQPKQTKTYILMADKRFASVSIPISLQDQHQFELQATNNLLILGIYFGALILIVVYSLVVYFKIKEAIFFWYAFYILFLGLYLAAHLGLLFQFSYPNNFDFNDYARPVFVTWLSTGLVRFIQLLIKTKKYMPRIEIWYKVLLWTLNIVTIWWWFTPHLHDVQTIWFLNIQNTLIVISLVMVLISAIVTFKKQRTIITFFFGAFLAVLIGGLSVILIEMGLVSEDIFPMNPILLGSMIEIVVFAMGLSYWMKIMNDERISLAKEVKEAKDRMAESFISGIETEKQKIASELHDDIGSRLSHIKRSIESQNGNSELLLKLEELNKTVRHLSHELAPPKFEQDEFLNSVQHLIRSHESNKLVLNFQVFDVPQNLSPQIQKQLYRIIQSALSNIELHAEATNVDVQFFYHNNELVLAIEDNGLGFVLQDSYSGNGIKSMQSRVDSLKGIFEISSSLRFGTSIMVTVPVQK